MFAVNHYIYSKTEFLERKKRIAEAQLLKQKHETLQLQELEIKQRFEERAARGKNQIEQGLALLEKAINNNPENSTK